MKNVFVVVTHVDLVSKMDDETAEIELVSTTCSHLISKD